jgi:hypothetical protein
MSQRDKGDKGYRLEELLRAYFLRSGFFVVRGVPFVHAGDDLTDIDLWLYERPTGSSRRRQIVDAKSKTKPKAVERLLWTKGLAELLDVDGAWVATTDARPMLRNISKKLGISVLDGSDIRRISDSNKVAFPERLAEEDLLSQITAFDRTRRNKEFQQQYHDIKHALIDNFGPGTVNRALDMFAFAATTGSTVHPDSTASEIALRLTYFAAAIAAIGLDFVNAEVSFRSAEERERALVNAIRYGTLDEASGSERIRLALGLVEKYAPSGDAAARAIDMAVKKDLTEIPAEMVAEHIVKKTKAEDLFQIARRLEQAALSRRITPFDGLGVDEKSFIAVLLDFSGVDRVRFASSQTVAIDRSATSKMAAASPAAGLGPLFSAAEKRNGE